MKKAPPGGRGPAAQSPDASKRVNEYLAGVPESARGTLNELRAMIRSAAPPETTETISYGMPAFRYKGVLMCYAAFTNHCSLFPMSAAVVDAFKDQLKNFKTSKGTIRFPLDEPPPLALVRELVKARVAEKERRQQR